MMLLCFNCGSKHVGQGEAQDICKCMKCNARGTFKDFSEET